MPSYADQEIIPFEFIYDAEHDQVSIHSNGSRLKAILGSFSLRTGIETFLHPEADRNIVFNIDKKPLEQAIKNLCKQLNCIVSYDTEKATQKNLLISFTVLPTGNENSDMLQPVVPISTELAMHAQMHQSPRMYQLIQKRLAIRLEKLPEDQKQEIVASYQEKIKHFKQRTERREMARKRSHQRREDQRNEKMQRLEAMRQSDPAAYDVHLQRQQQAELLYGPNPNMLENNH